MKKNKFWKDKNIFITGATGVVGKPLLQKLIDNNHNIYALSRSNETAKSLSELKVTPISGDLFEPSLFEQLNEHNIDAIFHVAGMNKMCAKNPDAMFHINIEGTKSMLDLGNKLGIKKFIYTSSAVTLGEEKGQPGNEDAVHRGSFLSNYEKSKFEAEVEAFKYSKNFEFVSVNPSSVQGPGRVSGTAKLLISSLNKKYPPLLKNNISIIVLHTRLDNHPEGVNHVLCDRLKINNSRVLIPKKNNLKKLIAYVPESHTESVLDALHVAGAGNLGKYRECSFLLDGTGSFKGIDKSNPHIGKPSEKVSLKEVQINVVFESHLLNEIQKALREAHPYETVAYEVYSLINSFSRVGIGRIGSLEKEMDLSSFLNHLKKQLKSNSIRHSPPPKKLIKKVAVVAGSGSFAIEDAIYAKVDCFVTSDLKYHDYFKADNKILLADIGHYESEQFTKELILEFLNEKIPKFACIISKSNTNPVNYF